MKKLYTIVLLGIILTFGCTKLEIAPEDALTEDLVFTNLDAYRSYLAKLYASYSLTGQDGPNGDSDISIVNDEGFTSYIRVYWKAQELTTDEAVIGWTDAGIRDLHEHSWSSENQFVRVLYYRIALIVSIANDFLKQSEEDRLEANGIAEADRAEIRTYRAEARYLRALAYWHALDLFRNVPLQTAISVDLPAQVSPQELYGFIQSELADIESEMAAPRMNEYGRADVGALWMLQAKLYLNAEHTAGINAYQECLEACNKVISAGYSLDTDYETLFMKDNHLSNEIIFALNSDGTFTQGWGCTTFLVHGAIGGTMDDSPSTALENYGVNAGWGGMRTTSTMVEKFPDVTGDIDSRAIFYTDGQTLEIEDIGTFEQGYAVPKYKNLNQAGEVGSNATHTDTDYPMFRLGDAYLMYAEATLRGASGDLGQALNYINELRERAYGNLNGAISQTDLDLAFILDERLRELYWEGTRRIDLIRFGQFTDQGIWPWKGNVMEGRTTEKFRDIFPIPASDLLANPSLLQNDGY